MKPPLCLLCLVAHCPPLVPSALSFAGRELCCLLSGVLQRCVHFQFYNITKRTSGSCSQGEIFFGGRSAAEKMFIHPSKFSMSSEGRLAFACLRMHCSNFISKGGWEHVSKKFPYSTLNGTSWGFLFLFFFFV